MHLLKSASVVLIAAAISACAGPAPTKAAAPNNEDWYQVRTDNELYLFDDYAVFREFLVSGKAPNLQKLDKQDKYGKDVILALGADTQGKDVKKSAAYQFFNVALPPAHPFYGELRQDGVIYVFGRYGDMIDVYKIGEPIFTYNDIGGGPDGERVVYVLAKEEKKPEKLIKLFQSKYPK
jgi:hypothetical protein